jgi:Protein of unknown function (DUF3606)
VKQRTEAGWSGWHAGPEPVILEGIMADDLNQRGEQDGSRIDIDEPREVRYPTKEPGVSQQELARIVRQHIKR